MARKMTKTQRNIAAINRNINKVAETFGKDSAQYQAVTQDIFRFQTYTNKHGNIQIRDIATNSKQYHELSARARRRLNVAREKKREMKRMEEFNKRAKTKISSLKAFEALQQIHNDKVAFVYDIRDIAQEYGVEFSEYKALQSVEYLKSKISEIEAEAGYDMNLYDESKFVTPTVTISENGIVVIVDTQTGETLYEYSEENEL